MCDLESIGVPSIFKLIRKTAVLTSKEGSCFCVYWYKYRPILTGFYFEQWIKRPLKGIHICGCRYNERLKVKTDGSTLLTYTGMCGELEHLKIYYYYYYNGGKSER